jgi:transposase
VVLIPSCRGALAGISDGDGAIGRGSGRVDGETPRSPGHAFYDRLQDLLRDAGFDAFVEEVCEPYYAPRMGAPSLPPGRYFRMHMIGYFEGIDSERGIAWRCADSLSLRDFLRLSNRDKVPDHSWLSRTRSRLPHEAHEKAFGFVLKLVAEHGLLKGERIGVDGSTMEANAALRTIVRRDNGETYRQMLTRMAKESGVDTPNVEDLARFDRKRKDKTLSNADWKSPTDPEAKIAKMKDGTTHLAYKPEHAVDLDTGVVVAAPIHPADEGDATTLSPTLEAAKRNLDAVGLAPSEEEPCVLVADKGYHAREQLKALDGGSVEDAHRRARAGQGLSALAWRRGRQASGLRQPGASEIHDRARDDAPARRVGRAVLRPYPRSRRHAARLAARTRERPQALSDPRRRVQPRPPDARALREGNAEAGRGGSQRHRSRPANRHRPDFRPDRRHQRRTCGVRYRHRHKHQLKTRLRHRTDRRADVLRRPRHSSMG